MSALKFSKEVSCPDDSVSICSNDENVIFLGSKNPTPKKDKIKKENPVTESEYRDDAEKLTATALKEKYPLTYDSWKNMKARCKTHGKILDPRFNEFRQFLTLMGPRGSSNFTLDRVDSENPNYSPENCRWADKHTQNQNKGNNKYLTYKGETHTVSVWAKKTNQKADTLYHRIKRGLSDAEVITGILSPKSIPDARRICLKKLPSPVLADVAASIFLQLRHVNSQLEQGYDDWLTQEISPPSELIGLRDQMTQALRDYTHELSFRLGGFNPLTHVDIHGDKVMAQGRGPRSKEYLGYLADMYRLTGEVEFKERMDELRKQ